jgi:hypothetical protein
MLRKMRSEEMEDSLAYAYALAQNPQQSSFPIYTDGIKTREDFAEVLKRDASGSCGEVLVYEEQGIRKGLIAYYWDDAERYLSFNIFNVEAGYGRAIPEVYRYACGRFPGFTIDFGFPTVNTEALSALSGLGLRKIEQSFVNVMLFADYEKQAEAAGIVPVTMENFALFQELHDPIAADMYWNSERIRAQLSGSPVNTWHVLLAMRGNQAQACIYFVFLQKIKMMEIFGIDFRDRHMEPGILQGLLASALNEAKDAGMKSIYYFTDSAEEQKIVEALGLKHISDYSAYHGIL